MAPNAHGLFNKLGIDLSATGANEVQRIREYSTAGEIIREIPIGRLNAIWQHKWMLAHRVRLHEALKSKALEVDKISPPCELHLDTSVETVDPENAVVTLKDGSQMTADLVIGADGVHSKSRRHVRGGESAQPFGSGKSGFRFMIPRQEILDDPATKALCDQPGGFNVVIGADRRLIMYPTSNNTLLNFLAIHPEAESKAGEDWNTETSRDAMLHVYRDFAPAFKALLAKADPASLKLWKLMDMEVLPTWANGRFALIGDAAHPFLPHQGQGAAQAMEDAVALGTVLEKGLTVEEVPARLALYDSIRHERASKVQEFTRLAGLDVQDGKLDTIEYANYNFGHDEFDNSAQRLREWKWAQASNTTLRMPVAFGPEVPHTKGFRSSPTFRTACISFRTSRTLVKNLLPPGDRNFTFQGPGTFAIASLVQTTFTNVEYLGGESYSMLGLYINGVVYKSENGDVSNGSHPVVLFETLPYTVIRDRETYGLPAIEGESSAEYQSTVSRVVGSSHGHPWLTMTLNNLEHSTITEHSSASKAALLPTPDAGSALLSWRSMPAFHREGEAAGSQSDAFAVKIPLAEVAGVEIEQVFTSTNASIQLSAPSTAMIDPVVERIAGIPIYQITSATVVSGKGTPAFKTAFRI